MNSTFRLFLIPSLLLISIGNGSIRACITSLGGSQFKLPEQQKLLDNYFSHYYFIYTLGIVLSKIVPPAIRGTQNCIGKVDCYSTVFGTMGTIFMFSWSKYFFFSKVPTLLINLFSVTFLIGLKFYKKETPANENLIGKIIKCSWSKYIKQTASTFDETFTKDVHKILKV